ncbi:MAG: hypothetical protein N3B16_04475 [Candidatus Aminicenantes bacterium]|nr:hypothetical protein [Candidatus Aminicenantes bacterium]
MPEELFTALEGVAEREYERERAEWIRMAWFVSILLAPHNNGRMLEFNDLLPECFQIENKKMTREDVREELEALKKRLGIE